MKAVAFVAILSIILLSTTALADVPGLINYQGTLTDSNGVALDTTVSMTFSIYSDSTGGTQVWTETQATVEVNNGIFNVLLGSVNTIPDAVFSEPDRWMALQVGGDAEMSPRQRIGSAAYAFRAAEADTAEFARSGGGGDDGDWTISGDDLYSAVSGDVGIGVTNPLAKLHSKVNTNGGAGFFQIDDPSNYYSALYAVTNGGGYGVWGAHDTSGNYGCLGGSDYAGYFNGDVHISDHVGIGTTSPQDLLHVGTGDEAIIRLGLNPQLLLQRDVANSKFRLKLTGGGYLGNVLQLGRDDQTHDIALMGDVGIGTTSPCAKLEVITSGSTAVHGENTSSGTYSDLGSIDYAVYGATSDSSGYAVYGINTAYDDYGCLGAGPNSAIQCGVYGHSSINFGVVGSGYGCGVGGYGQTSASRGVYGKSTHGEGVYGETQDGTGVYGNATIGGYAGYFEGDVHIMGIITKGGGSFVIDHPLDPQNKLLRHNFVESPKNLLIYTGKIMLDAAGEAIVHMPDYFEALTKENEAIVSLTPVGQPFSTGYEWQSDQVSFKVYGQPNREISWVVYAERDDPVMHQLRKPVEEEKGPDNKLCDRGELLYPVAYGYPESMGKDYKKREETEKLKQEALGGGK